MSIPCQKGEEQRQRQKMGQEVAQLRHQVGAQGVVLHRDMHMHPADEHAPRDAPQGLTQVVVAVLAGVVLALPVGRTGGRTPRSGRGRSPPRGAPRRRAGGAGLSRASPTLRATRVPISIWHWRNSGLTWPSSSAWQACIRPSGASARSRLPRWTSRYSSSIPIVKLGWGRGKGWAPARRALRAL